MLHRRPLVSISLCPTWAVLSVLRSSTISWKMFQNKMRIHLNTPWNLGAWTQLCRKSHQPPDWLWKLCFVIGGDTMFFKICSYKDGTTKFLEDKLTLNWRIDICFCMEQYEELRRCHKCKFPRWFFAPTKFDFTTNCRQLALNRKKVQSSRKAFAYATAPGKISCNCVQRPAKVLVGGLVKFVPAS